MKTNNSQTQEILNEWQEQRQSAFDEIDITSAVMASIQPLTTFIPTKHFESSPWLEIPSIFTGLLRTSITLFAILIPA